MKYTTILFDMDGTLFDTEKIYHAAWNHAGIPDSLYLHFIGRDRGHIFDLIRQNTSLDPSAVQEAKNAYVQAAVKDSVPMKPYLVPTLQWLCRHGYHNCVATSSPEAVACRYLRISGTSSYFERIVSGNTLEHGKPAPDIYLLAAEEMGAAVSSCVVVEDSYNGVRSGHAAGMKTVMIPDEIPPDNEMRQTADVILKNLGELPGYLSELG